MGILDGHETPYAGLKFLQQAISAPTPLWSAGSALAGIMAAARLRRGMARATQPSCSGRLTPPAVLQGEVVTINKERVTPEAPQIQRLL
jgi:hypothetical protein